MRKLAVAASVAVIALSSCAAVAESDNNSVSQGGDKGAKVDPANRVGNWKIIGKIKPEADPLGHFAATFRVRNTSDAPDIPMLTVNVLKGQRIFSSMDCTGGEIKPRGVVTVDCFSTDKFKRGWSKVTVENTF